MEGIVVSGISGRFPQSDSVEEFTTNLFNNVNMVTDLVVPGQESDQIFKCGKLKDVSKFDAEFFGVHAKLADVMEPQLRTLLEVTYEAIVDAGVNPSGLRGTRTGVFVGVSSSESGEYWNNNKDRVNHYVIIGNALSMLSNRISYSFDFVGPSITMDTACSSSGEALHQAVLALRNGDCDAAIVAGTNLALNSYSFLKLGRMKLTSSVGACQTFDASADGYVRSESSIAVLLQNRSVAFRLYCTVLSTATNCDGYKDEGITYPKGRLQRLVTERAYRLGGVSPMDVAYVEAHGSGTKAGDFEETNWIADYFCKGRDEPLLIGSTKSNMGHAEAASGLASMVKIIIAMEHGVIPANLHYKTPNPAIPGLTDGRLKVVNINLPWNGGIVGMNNFGFGGVNVHAVLKSNDLEKQTPIQDGIPRLLCVSGRTESAVDKFLTKLEKLPRDDGLIGLIHKLHEKATMNHPYRGFTMLEGKHPVREIIEDKKLKKVWYVFTGMGCQWIGMGRALLELKSFRESMERCSRALAHVDFDLLGVIDSSDESNFDLMAQCAPCITSIQVALVDVLTLLGIKPDGIMGHSMGEIACAYADGSLTAEQAVLTSYWRGRCVDEDNTCPGAMAAVGLSWKDAQDLCAGTNVAPVCHNAADSVTISGPAADVEILMTKLENEGKFVKRVQSSNQALHTKYITKAGQKLLPILEKVIPVPKPRSHIWLSSSVPQHQWTAKSSQYSSAEYFTNNLLQPVLFYELVPMIPEKTVIIEIGPHALFQSLLRKMTPQSSLNIGLAKMGLSDGLGFLFTSLGKIYTAGLDIDIAELYPSLSFPVGRGTPMISPMVEWDHSVEWTVPNFDEATNETIVEINPSDGPDRYLLGHRIDGRSLFPGSGYITLVWKALAKLKNKSFEELPVCFENINFIRPTIVSDRPIKFLVRILEASDSFEIINNQAVVFNGQYRLIDSFEKETVLNLPVPSPPSKQKSEFLNGYEALPLSKSDVSKDLRLRGYEYQNEFQSIKKTDHFGMNGVIEWSGNWITFLDSILQMLILDEKMRQLQLPVRILRCVIDPKAHLKRVGRKSEISAQIYPHIGVARSGAVEIKGVKASIVTRRVDLRSPKLTYHVFVPFRSSQEMSKEEALSVLLQIVRSNCGLPARLKAVEIVDEVTNNCLLSPDLMSVYENEAGSVLKMTVAGWNVKKASSVLLELGIDAVDRVNVRELPIDNSASKHLICGRGLIYCLKNMAPTLVKGGFVFTREENIIEGEEIDGFTVVAYLKFEGNQYILLRLCEPLEEPEIIKITSNEFSWIERVKQSLTERSETTRRVILTNDLDSCSGLLGMFNCLRKEPGGRIFQSVVNMDCHEPIDFARHESLLKKNLSTAVMSNGQWGALFHLPLPSEMSMRCVDRAYVNTLTRGDLTSLRWIEGPVEPVKANHERCTVYYAPLNFKDVMLASGKLPPDALPGDQPELECIMGLEFSGRDSTGRRVMGMMKAQAMSTSVTVPSNLLWAVPHDWSLEQAATVPVVYSTCIYALLIRGQMKKGDSALIHTGSGGVGLAAIHLALHTGVEVFTTVGTVTKKEFLLKTFPELKPENVGNSRDTSFEQMVMDRTDGRGVDVVLNSLADDKLQASVRCLAEKGRFLEIGKFDLVKNSNLGMAHFLKNITFHGILLDNIFDENRYGFEKAKIVKLMNEGMKSGAVKPLPTTLFGTTQLEEAFRHLATGKHVGKVMIKLKTEEKEKILKNPTLAKVTAVVRTYFSPNKSYIITGGLGGLGIELCNWMLKRGGRHITLTTTSGVRKGYQALMLRRWAEKGFDKVVVYETNGGTPAEVTRLLESTNKKASVGGIFCLSGVIRDALMVNQSEQNFWETYRSKTLPTSLLDQFSRKTCPSLDYFVVFSSVASGRGNIGQTNYAFANSASERICEQRKKAGYPATAIQWGPISDVGMVADHELWSNDTVLEGVAVQKIASFFETLDVLLQEKRTVVASTMIARKEAAKGGSPGGNYPAEVVANILGIKNYKTIAPSTSLVDLGMDSLMGAEIKQTLERDFDVILDAKEIKNLTFGSLLSIRSNCAEDKTCKTHDSCEFIGNQNVQFLEANVMPLDTIVKMTDSPVVGRPVIFMVHPIEGTVDALMPLARRLEGKEQIYGLQCTKAAPIESINSLASFYLKEIKKIQPFGPYRLVGYSYGAYVACEMAMALEMQKTSVKITLFGDWGVEKCDIDDVLTRFTSAFTNINMKEEPGIQDASELTKLSHCSKKLAEATGLSETVWFDAVGSYWKKTKALAHYKPSSNDLRCQCLLLKTDSTSSTLHGLLRNADVRILAGDHRSILNGKNAAQVSQLISNF